MEARPPRSVRFAPMGTRYPRERAPHPCVSHPWAQDVRSPGAPTEKIESATMGAKQAVQGRSVERLKFFSDAVVAIAMTLLVLPLLESVPEAAADGKVASEWLGENVSQLIGLFVSFGVVAGFWIRHHQIFERVERYTYPLIWLSFAWMLSVVFLQVPTALVYALPADRPLIALYIGTMTFGSAMLTAMAWTIYRHPECQSADYPMDRGPVITDATLTGLFMVALIIGVLIPSINYFGLLVLVLTGPVRRVVVRLLH